VLAQARVRIEKGHGDGVTLDVQLEPDERAQVGQLLGLAWETSAKPVTLGKFRAAVNRAGDDLHELLVRLGGPLADLPGQRAQERATRTAETEAAYDTLRASGVPLHAVDLAQRRRWLGQPGTGLISRAQQLARLWAILPHSGGRLSAIADQLYEDPHALDRDAELGRIAARLLAAASAEPDTAPAAAGEALAAAAWRQVWATVGVACDEVSVTVLILGLPLDGDAPAAQLSRTAAHLGEPVWLTARSLRGSWNPAAEVATVRVCENPAIVEAAADQLSGQSLPLVCTYGLPSSAVWRLLGGLSAAGVRLLVTADRDDAGRGFLQQMLRLPEAQEWLPEAEGLYEEARLKQLVEDLRAP
jgi:uncharacterized protein (TIGR02679 family)